MPLNIESHLARPDDFRRMPIDTHRDLTREDSEPVDCKLVLLLADHVWDFDGVGRGSAMETS